MPDRPIFDATNGVTRAAALTAALLCDDAGPREVAAVFAAAGERAPRVTAADVEQLRPVAVRVRDVLASGDLATAAARINELLAGYAQPPRLTDGGGRYTWHVHVHEDGVTLATRFAASSALSLATVLAERQRLPGGICTAPGCERPFADVGGGMPRRYCSERCATRARVAAHRSRHAA
ncbi:MAG TPA: CGNR zinc finger domain-containing protein [Solirubrobacteraceae bacterium]|jgi:predicted RNA-binding Zn ribbon-like protein|nr:CGNR zinc finger domain-containing protein [Solirubrobacteraceae bacterium]